MAASASQIRSALSTYLSAVTELKGGAFVGRTAAFSGFPCARFYLSGIQEEKENEDTAQNYRVYVYSIDIVMSVQISGLAKSSSEGEFEDAVDAVMDKLRTEWTLGGILEGSSIEPSTVRYEESAQGVVVYLPITFYAKTLISI
jgi:hypothetical protein